ncbi:MAG TPA: MBL fold metallo-hydrolase, partial [Sphingomicrobium sp.]
MARLTVSAVPVLTDNYVWLIHDEKSGETAAVDPSVAEPVLDAAATSDLKITQVLNTHWHPDHTG